MLVLVAVLTVGVASWVLDVAAKAPPLSDCKPIDQGGNSILFAGDGSRLGYIASDEARTPVAISESCYRRICCFFRIGLIAASRTSACRSATGEWCIWPSDAAGSDTIHARILFMWMWAVYAAGRFPARIGIAFDE